MGRESRGRAPWWPCLRAGSRTGAAPQPGHKQKKKKKNVWVNPHPEVEVDEDHPDRYYIRRSKGWPC